MHVNKLLSLKGKIAIVTGGAGYFGKPISTALAEAGGTVIIASRNKQNCDELAATLTQQGLKAEGAALDLNSETSINNFVADVINKYGKIDVLVNNAVTREGFKNLEDVTVEQWEEAQKINATGLMLISKAVVKQMVLQKSGNIINISSIQGVNGPNFPVYGSTGMTSPVNYSYDKWGMVGFTKWMANYYGKHNIRVNCISPGGYGPHIENVKGIDEFLENYKRLTPLCRFADDDDIKGPVVFLASEAGRYVTGHNLLVEGGWANW